jgi:predicted DsbA family dithiol-disulfide isomerase
VRIDLYSDVVCPWCFVAKRRLDAALADLADDPDGGGGSWVDDVQVRWRAFQLDPGAGPEPGDLQRSIDAKYGPGAFGSMTRRLGALGGPLGIDFRFDIAVRVNTFDAHRLLAWALATSGTASQNRLADVVFSAYFEHGADVSDHATLASVAGSAGLDASAAATMLASHDMADHVTADLAAARNADIHAVPTMVVAERLMIPGAQEPETLRALLVRAHQRIASPG